MNKTLYLITSLLASICLTPVVSQAAEHSATAASASGRTAPGEPVQVEGAWVRSAVVGQQGTGGFMRITARQPMQLIGVATPVAGTAEIHEMKMEGDVMRMRAVGQVELPAGQAVEFKPGGYHLMLMDLKQPLKPGTRVALTLVLRDALGNQRKLDLSVPVAAQAPGAPQKH